MSGYGYIWYLVCSIHTNLSASGVRTALQLVSAINPVFEIDTLHRRCFRLTPSPRYIMVTVMHAVAVRSGLSSERLDSLNVMTLTMSIRLQIRITVSIQLLWNTALYDTDPIPDVDLR